jgi:hypothetical protein
LAPLKVRKAVVRFLGALLLLAVVVVALGPMGMEVMEVRAAVPPQKTQVRQQPEVGPQGKEILVAGAAPLHIQA